MLYEIKWHTVAIVIAKVALAELALMSLSTCNIRLTRATCTNEPNIKILNQWDDLRGRVAAPVISAVGGMAELLYGMVRDDF